MPEWVRTMQAGQSSRGSMPAPDGVGFSARALMNEDALPQWLREAGAGGGGGGPQPPQSGYGAPGYGAAGGMGGAGVPWGQGVGTQGPGYGQPAGQNAFDESNLPDWLLQPGANGGSARPYDAYPTARQPAPYGAPPAPAPGYNGAAAAGGQNAFPGIEQAGVYRPAPSGGLSGNSLLDDNALPGWMRGDPAPAQGDPAAAYRDAAGMRGSSLIDPNALPAWMRNQPGAASAQPAPPVQPLPQPSAGPSIANWIGASTANDPMPSWLGQAYSDARVPPLQPPAPPAQGQAGAGWPPNGAPPNGGAQPLPGTLNANSLMDESALPAWLRAQGQPQAGGGAPASTNLGPTPMGHPHSGTLADMHTVRMPHSARLAPPDAARNGYADEPEPQRFSASDLIDPDVLPGFLGGGNAGAMPAPPAAGPFGAPAGNYAASSRAPGSWAGRDVEAVPERDQSYGRPSRGAPIPEDELPEWLQGPGPDPFPMQRASPSARRGGYDSQRMPVPRDWNDEHYDASAWSESYEDQDPADYYPDEPPPRDRRGRGQRDPRDGDKRGGGGGRRERRGFFGR